MFTEKISEPRYWLMKAEPRELPLERFRKKTRVHWDGVRNFAARNFMRQMHPGDLAILYYSNGAPSGPAAIMRVVRAAYPDFTQWKRSSPRFDPRASKDHPIWDMVDVTLFKAFSRVIPREILREVPSLRDMVLWKRPRLSITPLTRREFETIANLGMKRTE